MEKVASCIVHHDVIDLTISHVLRQILLLRTLLQNSFLLLRSLGIGIEVIEQKIQVLLVVLRHHIRIHLHVLLCVYLELDLVLAVDVNVRSVAQLIEAFIRVLHVVVACSGLAAVVLRGVVLVVTASVHEV